ncbi:MAG: hypothetical protein C4589_12630 [Peptococcaceae bacterium]|nr:MAG: hypothetical protein C4589_12630 [Peptococcaceae bacterium]
MEKIKTAYEKAMERFQQKEVSPAELDRLEYLPKGKALAAAFLNEKNLDLAAELAKYPAQFRPYVLEGARETFLQNILLPSDETIGRNNKRALEGIFLLKQDKHALGEISSQMEHLFEYYRQALAQAATNYKESFTARMGAAQKALEKRAGRKVKINPEKHPGYREGWLKMVGRLNAQYESALNEQKQKLREVK